MISVSAPLSFGTEFRPNPIPWSGYPEECLWYFVPMSIVHVGVFLIGVVTLAIVRRHKRDSLLQRIGAFGMFIILFLIVGSLFNGLWSCLVYNRLYHSTDYIFDFIPFWPITWVRVDTPWGDGHGRLFVSLFELRLVWLLFAISTWGLTIFLYRQVRPAFAICPRSPKPTIPPSPTLDFRP
jgi:hypothetical protein